MAKVLFLGSDAGNNPIKANLEGSYIQMAYRSCKAVDFVQYSQVLIPDFGELIHLENPDILHITCHGTPSGLCLARNATSRDIHEVSTAQLSNLLAACSNVKVVYIDACHSSEIAKSLYENDDLGLKLTIGHSDAVNVSASYLGARAFHSQLSRGASYEEALHTLQSTVNLVDASNQVSAFNTTSWLKNTLLPPLPHLIARFAKDRPMGPDKNGIYSIEFGATGFEPGLEDDERCVVSIFSDDESLVGGAFTTVEAGYPAYEGSLLENESKAPLTFWTHNYGGPEAQSELWEVDGNFIAFMSYCYKGDYDIVRASLKTALRAYYSSDFLGVDPKTRAEAEMHIRNLR